MKKVVVIIITAVFVTLSISACGFSQGVRGKITDSIYGDNVANLEVTLVNLDKMYNQKITSTSDENGEYSIKADAGKYRIEVEDSELTYKRYIKPIDIPEGIMDYDVQIEPIVKTWIHGLVAEYEPDKPDTADYKNLIAGAEIEIDGIKSITDENGNFEIKYIRPGLKKVTIKAEGYKDYIKAYNLSRGETIEYFEIEPASGVKREKVSKLTNLLSYRSEVLKGTSPSDITETSTFVAITSPYAFNLESTIGDAKYFGGISYALQNGEFTEVSTNDIERQKKIVDASVALVEGLADYVNATDELALGVTTVSISGYGCQPFEFSYKSEDGKEWNVSLWAIIDGQFTTYPARVIMERNGEYVEINYFALNDYENQKAVTGQ
ncbi:MAG TPA: carboxypeptidase regulatory-like domain-containing protein [Caldisericia bacterium]|nr:carboxypeptidase regulatory-like domain-containing protein [Caldisericia bacterium]HPF48257.1 carboxypeptidase regulatory-like domain-containing protein [Caldisericia bacterium]HPI83807.1 carboxypeptidase regulatory-like domain-containing protein [Caldisericia bacterium]HPQ92710.1 carboxypeptidase regulatory-like domain-containing protein [Caldisericia bacterium]HRV74192.1 carboxypeptidase regulatory-like domain-containing protein [Caldisericia bacterium]